MQRQVGEVRADRALVRAFVAGRSIDHRPKVAFGHFLATFAFAMTVLVLDRARAGGIAGAADSRAVTVASLLVAASLKVFVGYVTATMRLLQVSCADSPVRLVVHPPSWHELLDLAFLEIAGDSASSPQVARRLLAAYESLASAAPPDLRPGIEERAATLVGLIDATTVEAVRPAARRPDPLGLA
jgi:uncharacterized membrane protein